MDKVLYLTFLYDFYSELLTDKQKEIFEMYYLENLSMQEIAEQFDISRQSINDLLKRTEKILKDYEAKLMLNKIHNENKLKIDNIFKSIDKLECKYLIDKNDVSSIKKMILEIEQ